MTLTVDLFNQLDSAVETVKVKKKAQEDAQVALHVADTEFKDAEVAAKRLGDELQQKIGSMLTGASASTERVRASG
jgi:hypothetical protein